ncbi:MAG: DNA-formamidopyrimidine glycosylase family protein [Acidimicrobiales bacterium]
MPELPDVERSRRLLHSHVVGEKVQAVDIRDPGVIRGRSSRDFVRRLVGRTFGEPTRHGKWLLAPTDGPTVLFHFGMTGDLIWDPPDAEYLRYDRVIISVGSGNLVYRDQRKLQGLWLADDEDAVTEFIGDLGPDALGLTCRQLEERLTDRRGALKAVLMDQHVVAGLGNMLCDEMLWRARIHPARRFGDLRAPERQALCRSLQRVLRASVQVGDIPRRATWLSSQRSQPEPRCPRCGSSLELSRIGGRTTYWCPTCQPAI